MVSVSNVGTARGGDVGGREKVRRGRWASFSCAWRRRVWVRR